MRTACSILRSVFVFIAAVFLILLLAGCQTVQPNYMSALVSPKGVKAELFMPKDVLAVVKFGTDNAIQQNNLAKILGNFPQSDVKNLVDEALTRMNQQMVADNMSFENDIVPIFGDHFQSMLAVTGHVAKDIQPRIVFVVTLGDPQKAKLFFDNEVEKQIMNTQSYKSATIYQMTDTQAFFTISQDVLVMTNSIAQMQYAIDAGVSPSGTLLENVIYQKGLSTVQGSLGFLFIDMSRLFADFQNYAVGQGTQMVLNLSAADKMDGEIFAFYAEPNGFRVKSLFYEKDGVVEPSPNSLNPVYLDKEVTGDGVIFYTEAFNFKRILEVEERIFRNVPGFDQMIAMVRKGFADAGLDPDKDILSLMDRGVAFYLRDSGSMMPSFGGLIDASSNVVDARKTMSVFDQVVTGLMPKIKADPTFGSVVSHEQAMDNYSVTLRLDKLTNQGKKVMEDLANFVPVFRYGVSPNNIFNFSLVLQAFDGSGSRLHDNQEYQTALKHIEGDHSGIIYVSMSSALTYFERLVKFVDAYGSPVMVQNMRQYEHIKTYLIPIRSLIFGIGNVSSSPVEINGFIEIGSAG